MVTRWCSPPRLPRELGAYQGSAFSCAPRLTQSAWFRPHNRDPHIPGLYIVGAGTHPGAGVPGVINSAKATAGVIAEDFAAEPRPTRPATPRWRAAARPSPAGRRSPGVSPAATARDAGAANPIAAARAVLAAKSKSFALAGRLLAPRERDRAAVVYAFCRRADDAIDLNDRPHIPNTPAGSFSPTLPAHRRSPSVNPDVAAPDQRAGDVVARLAAELDAIVRGDPTGDPVLDAFGRVARDCAIPRAYPDELLAGMAMDARGHRYATTLDLLRYCYRVAGTVGLMMCHVMGVADDRALVPAVHLGIAMQLTNISRDVHEDWCMGRLYVPAELLEAHGGPADLDRHLGRPLPAASAPALARAVAELLALADRYYASADRGLIDLPWRAALAIRTARLCYAAIGERVRAQGCDPLAGRAVVPGRAKLAMAGRATAASAAELPARLGRMALRAPPRVPSVRLEFGPEVILSP